MDTIKFANGAVYDCPAVYADAVGTAFVILSGMGIAQIAQIATDESMTSEFEWGGWRYTGYTHCQAVTERPEGAQMILHGGHFEQVKDSNAD